MSISFVMDGVGVNSVVSNPFEGLRLVPFTNDTIDAIHPLMDSQAKAHKTWVKGDRSALVETFTSSDPRKRILDGFMVVDPQGTPLSFVTISYADTPKGRVLYLEDIHTLPIAKDRNIEGLGRFAYNAVRYIALKNDCIEVPCTVDSGNDSANGFYTHFGARKHPVPILGMEDFKVLKVEGRDDTAVVVSRASIETLQTPAGAIEGVSVGDNITTLAERDFLNHDLTGAFIYDAPLQQDDVRIITASDVSKLENTARLMNGSAPTHLSADLIASLHSVVKDPRNFCVASFNRATGMMKSATFVRRTFSTFNNIERFHLGETVSLTGEHADQQAVLDHIMFCQALDSGGRIEVQLSPIVAKNPELAKLFAMCKSRMTENDTDEFEYAINTDYDELSAWIKTLPLDLRSDLEAIVVGEDPRFIDDKSVSVIHAAVPRTGNGMHAKYD